MGPETAPCAKNCIIKEQAATPALFCDAVWRERKQIRRPETRGFLLLRMKNTRFILLSS